MPDEKRKEPRIPIQMSLRTTLAGIALIRGEAVNLSSKGMGIVTKEEIPAKLVPGNNIIVHLSHPDFHQDLDIPAKIRWIERNPEGSRMGIELTERKNPDKDMYLSWLEHLNYQKQNE